MMNALTSVGAAARPRSLIMARRLTELTELRERLAETLTAPKRVLVDCRLPTEVAAHPLASPSVSVHIARGDISASALDAAVHAGAIPADKTTPIIVACAGGARSGLAKRRLEVLGYTRVVNGVSPDVLNPLL